MSKDKIKCIKVKAGPTPSSFPFGNDRKVTGQAQSLSNVLEERRLSAPIPMKLALKTFGLEKALERQVIDTVSHHMIFRRVFGQIVAVCSKQPAPARLDAPNIISLEDAPPKIACPLHEPALRSQGVVAQRILECEKHATFSDQPTGHPAELHVVRNVVQKGACANQVKTFSAAGQLPEGGEDIARNDCQRIVKRVAPVFQRLQELH